MICLVGANKERLAKLSSTSEHEIVKRKEMGSLYLNRLSNEERQALSENLLGAQHGNCFICGELIDPVVHAGHIDIDHVEPTKAGGKDGPDNFAITHASCNRAKQTSNLRVARLLAAFDKIRESVSDENRPPNLGDVLSKYGGAKFPTSLSLESNSLKLAYPEIGENDILTETIYEDEMSGFRSAFINVPIEYLHHDDHINPRAIGKNLKKLVEEFHRKRPQLHIALGWINTTEGTATRIRIFDGQHKAAAQILLGTKRLLVRVFIDPDADTLLTANTHAGTTLRQVAFDKSVQRSLGSSLLADRMTRYRQDRGMNQDDESFTERDLVNHFKGESREMKRYILDWVRNSITTHSNNKLRDYIDYGGRGTEMPLSYSTIEKTFYSLFVYNELLTTPFNHKSEEGTNPREIEIEQIVRLMNIIAEKIYVGKFEHTLGTRRIESNIQKGKDVPELHLRAYRMAKEEIILNWLRYIKQIVQNYFITNGQPIDEKKLFQYPIPEACWENISNFVDALKRLPLWMNRDLSLSVFGGKQNADFWQHIFESGRTRDGSEVMYAGINLMEMIQPDNAVSEHAV